MGKRIIAAALLLVMEDIKLVRIAFITSFCHSLIVMFLLTFYLNNMMVARFEKGIPLWDALQFLVTASMKGNLVMILIIAIIILLIGYGVLYPVWQAALIHYLHDKKFSMRDAMAKWVTTFFPMFEFGALEGTFSISSLIFIVIRLFMLDIMDNWFIRAIVIIQWLTVLVVSILWPYTRYIIILEWLSMYDAIKRSAYYSIRNLWQTIKFVLLQLLLLTRFFVNILIIVWIPLILTYIASRFHIINFKTVEVIIIIIWILLLFGTAYINGIIEAFFASYWYKIYHKIVEEIDK